MTLHPMEVSLHISSSDERLKNLDSIDAANICQYVLLDSFWWIGDGILAGRILSNVTLCYEVEKLSLVDLEVVLRSCRNYSSHVILLGGSQ